MTFESRPRRTAVLVEDVKARTSIGSVYTLAAGTKLFAENYVMPWEKGPGSPVEWCTVLPQGVSGTASRAESVCIFWDTAQRAHYVQTTLADGVPYQLSSMSTEGMSGPTPKLREERVDLDVKLVSKVQVAKLSNKGVELEQRLSDGTSERGAGVKKLKWNAEQKADYENTVGQFVLTAAADYSSVQFAETPSSVAGRTPGATTVRVCLNEIGEIKGEPQVIESSGKPRLDEAAIGVAKKGRYSPDKARTTNGCVDFKVKFELKDQ